MKLKKNFDSKKKVAIMQPYFLPYHGYFKLIKSVDCFIIYDDVQWIRRGWMNRNRIIYRDQPQFITIPVLKSPQKTVINQKLLDCSKFDEYKNRILENVNYSYKSFSNFKLGYELLRNILSYETKYASEFISNSLKIISNYLGLNNSFLFSSHLKIDNNLKGQQRILNIAKSVECDHYINAIGGKDLYDEEIFNSEGMEISFLKPNPIKYSSKEKSKHLNSELSILDLIMRESSEYINEELNNYQLI